MEYQWGAGCTERCKSGSERGLQKPVFQRHKALLSYSTISARRPFPRGRTAQAIIAECWRYAQRRIRTVWTMPFFCASAMAARGQITGSFTVECLRPSQSPMAAQALHPLRLRCPISESSIPRRFPAAVRTGRSALCRSDEVERWAHFRQRPTAAQRLAMHNMVPRHGARAAAAARARGLIRARLPPNPAWA